MMVPKGSSILGTKRGPLKGCFFFNKNNNLAVKSDTALKSKSLAPLRVIYDRFE